MYPYRVFVSYSRIDLELMKKVAAHLESLGLTIVCDANLTPGERFPEQLRKDISHAHVFLPLLTESSAQKPWVHQETGYAMGLEIPVLPIAVGAKPSEMLTDLQAVMIDEKLSELSADQVSAWLCKLTARPPECSSNLMRAGRAEVRTKHLGDLTREAYREKTFGPLRQRGAYSSFCLPDAEPSDKIWRDRDGEVVRSSYMYELLAEERRAFQEYVAAHGARLIIDPFQPLKLNGDCARCVRLNTLLTFLTDESVGDVQVAVRKGAPAGNLAIVGDWYSAVSVTPIPGVGYEETLFTWHAPSVLKQIRGFDLEFAALLAANGVSPEDSRRVAAKVVKAERDALLCPLNSPTPQP